MKIITKMHWENSLMHWVPLQPYCQNYLVGWRMAELSFPKDLFENKIQTMIKIIKLDAALVMMQLRKLITLPRAGFKGFSGFAKTFTYLIIVPKTKLEFDVSWVLLVSIQQVISMKPCFLALPY